ncbi:NHL repeat-containing protein [Metarhizium brunneum]
MAPLYLFLAALYTGLTLAAQCQSIQPKSDPQTAPGVTFKVLANDLSKPRGVIADPKGNLLVVEAGAKGVRRIELDDGKGLDTCVTKSSSLVDDETLNHGIELSSDGKTLFVSSSTDVYAYDYDAEKGTVGKAKNIITGMDQGGHATRTLLIPKHNSNLLLVSRGSDGNIDKDTVEIGSAKSQIRIFKIDHLLKIDSPVRYSDGEVLGWGLRNSVGVAEDPVTGYVWSVENSIDDMQRNGVDVHNSNPGEELNFHGLPNDTTSDVYGKNFGYPSCVAIFDTSNVNGYPGGAKIGLQMVGDQMPNNYTDRWCQEDTLSPYITFGSHLAPLDIKFNFQGSAALISFHGSWNRKPPNGYRLSRVAFSEGYPKADKSSPTAEQELMWNKDNSYLKMLLTKIFFASLATGELILNYDGSLEGRVEEFEVEEMVIDAVGGPSKLGALKNPLRQRDSDDPMFGSAALSADGVLHALNKRQSCEAGYWYCSGPCKLREQCCGNDRCIPSSAECCKNGRYCEAGNHCYILSSQGNLPVCCTDSRCTARVENGRTTYATSRTTTRTYTTTRKQYYYWTMTWYYYYYYWTYSTVIEASVVTSARTSTTSVLSVSTTAAAAASSYFSSVSSTLSFSTPASATSLASLTGSTRKGADSDGPTATDTPNSGGGSENTADNGGGNEKSSPTTAATGATGTRRPDSPGAAASPWSSMDILTTMFVALGVSTGALAVML